MSDIVERLRAITGQAGDYGDVQLCDAAADEIERLRGYRDEAEAEASIASLAAQRLRLTDAEREAVATAARIAGAVGEGDIKATLRGLLERMAL